MTMTERQLHHRLGETAWTPAAGDWPSLLRQIASEGRDGYLVWDADHQTRIGFQAGDLRDARWGGHVGLHALVRCLVRGSGLWLWQDGALATQSIDQDLETLLTGIEQVLLTRGLFCPDTDHESDEYPFDTAAFEQRGEGTVSLNRSTCMVMAFNPPRLGDRLGRCVLEEELGRGATSIVFKAKHRGLRIPVAVKVLLPEPDDDGALCMAGNEARILARLHHPAWPQIFDYDDDGMYPHLVMEYIDGCSLAEQLREDGQLDVSTVVQLIEQIASGLAHAEAEADIVHCDLKPSNILLGLDGRAHIADLGLARTLKSEASAISYFDSGLRTVDDRISGTPAYMAPEMVLHGPAAVDSRSDQYALGCICYHALAGRPPFMADDPRELMIMRTESDPLPINQVRARLPMAMVEFTHRLLQREPADRYPDYETLLSALAAVPCT